jgi:hypothetical protein
MRKFALLSVSLLLAFFLLSAPGVEGQIFRRPLSVCRPTYPIVTGPCVESRREELPVPQPSYTSPATEVPCSPVQVTALEPVPATGLRLPIGGLPSKIDHKLDPDQLAILKGLFSQKLEMPPVNITPNLPAGTSASLSRSSILLEVLLWLASVTLSGSMLGKLGPWVAPMARGLLSALVEKSRPSETTPGAPSSTAPSGS